jgi:hypothetical protein
VFGLAILGADQKPQYWTGGDAWDQDPGEAVIFYSESNAESTIDVLKKAFPDLSSTVHVVELEDEEDDEEYEEEE